MQCLCCGSTQCPAGGLVSLGCASTIGGVYLIRLGVWADGLCHVAST